MASFLERQADRLASRRSRRGFFGLAAKVTAAVAGAGFGISRFYNDAAADTYKCCTLAFGLCHTCPACPTDKNPYAWGCCYQNCIWECKECYADSCSCANRSTVTCGPYPCAYAPQ